MTDYGYARVSSLDQDPQIQINALERAGCWPVVQEKISGVAKRRPVRDELLRMAKPGDTITTWKLDRWGRSAADLLEVIGGLDERGIRFRCLTQPLDTRSAFGRMQLTLLAAFAEFERSLLLERTAAGRARRVAEGLHPGGVALYGLDRDHMTVIEYEAALLRYVAGYVLDGAPMNQIVDWLNFRGVRTREGKLWTVKTLVRILRNPYSMPVLGPEIHGRLARLFGHPDRQRQGRPAGHLLSGILHCGRCHEPLYATWTRQRRNAKRLVYACRKGMGSRFNGCGSLTVAAGRADDWAREAFLAAVVSDHFADALNRRQAELLSADVSVEALDDWRAEISDMEQVQGTRFYSDDMKRRHHELRQMVDAATARLLAQPDLQALLDLPRSEDALRARWEAWTIADRRVWLRRLLDRIEVKPAASRTGNSDVESRMDPIWRM